MELIPFEKTLADGAATEGGHRPTVVAAPAAASPELSDRPRRRTFTAAQPKGDGVALIGCENIACRSLLHQRRARPAQLSA